MEVLGGLGKLAIMVSVLGGLMFVRVGLGNGRMVYLFQQAGCGIKASVRWAEWASWQSWASCCRQNWRVGQTAVVKLFQNSAAQCQLVQYYLIFHQ